MKKRNIWKYAAVLSAAMIFQGTLSCTAAGTETVITLSDEGIQVDGAEISEDSTMAVYAGAEMIYYLAGQDTLYGEGGEEDGHTPEEAAEHTVITITQPGTYRVTGSISKGQIAVDLGEEAREDETAVVNLILDNADITCTAASAIVVYNAYECGSYDAENAGNEVDTANAGFNLILADGSENTINGSHVARIYKEGTTQEQVDTDTAEKLWKFDAAIDSQVSFNIDGEAEDNGKLTVIADNEGISSALHMTINGGEIVINSADDSINASEDYVSVLTINDGILTCDSGLGSEGDGIDSNGWIVVNGGYTIACANGASQDSGVDADMGIYLNGGTVLASGNMYDEVSADSMQSFLVMNFAETVEEGQLLMLKNANEEAVTAFSAVNPFLTMVYTCPELAEGEYTFYKVSSVTGDLNGSIYTNITEYQDEVQLNHSGSAMMGGFGGGRGFGGQMPQNGEMGGFQQMPENGEMGELPQMPENGEMGGFQQLPQMPENGEMGDFQQMPGGENGEMPERPENMGGRGMFAAGTGEVSTVFTVNAGANMYAQIQEAE